MPWFDYQCNACDTTFEIQCGLNDDRSNIACPDCGAGDVRRVYSTIYLPKKAGAASASSGKCASCSSGNCASCG